MRSHQLHQIDLGCCLSAFSYTCIPVVGKEAMLRALLTATTVISSMDFEHF
jgi:hypothetical protein